MFMLIKSGFMQNCDPLQNNYTEMLEQAVYLFIYGHSPMLGMRTVN